MKLQKINKSQTLFHRPDDFKNFFNTFFPVLTLYAKKYLEDVDEAYDIAQEAFVKVWEKRHELENEDSARYFLYTVVKNKCLNFIGHEKVKQNYRAIAEKEENPFFEVASIEQEVFILLRQSISEFAPQTRNILNMSLKGMANKDISKALGISENTIKTLKRRAFKKLYVQLKEHFYLFFI